ncbi:helix-turn-helix domain-containing protein [Laribacter hongkongensis]|uniref:Helix-turn-helix domain-containing protein n=1 Tax=Laribacter hongkongensis TaxID=168471 RepID=A0ABD4SUM1_9NEIS|nr:helix-turn-helix domain-containing protein [Laribacter hongkongensis]MCG9026936.1 helix-turn-helix domain-containing protein [Laribacter hongkongensis]MCG9100292.1 helix-turn-helix domain-containing protein [Laribacter hongkongensis]MCG9119652.1 helix-turn-helix domain-containing protein [Laribacter hongkongensis]
MLTIQSLVAAGRELVSTKEAAEAILFKEQTLFKWSCFGTGPIQPVRVGRSLRWRVSDLEKLVGGQR